MPIKIINEVYDAYLKNASIEALIKSKNGYRLKIYSLVIWIILFAILLFANNYFNWQIDMGWKKLFLLLPFVFGVIHTVLVIRSIKLFCQTQYGITYEKYSGNWNNDKFQEYQYKLTKDILVIKGLENQKKLDFMLLEFEKEIVKNSPAKLFGLNEINAVFLIIYAAGVTKIFDLSKNFDELWVNFLTTLIFSIGFYMYLRPHLGSDGMIFDLISSKQSNYKELKNHLIEFKFDNLSRE